MKSRFEHVSPADYAAVAVLACEVSSHMLARLDVVALKPACVMEVGCGIGYGVQLLQARYPNAELFAVEDAPEMLAYAAKVSGSVASVRWLHASFDQLPVADGSVDLLVGNLVLPWCTDLMKLLQEWRRVLRPEGLLMFSSFGPDTLRELEGQGIQLPYFADMHNLGDALMQAGFADPVLDADHFTLTYKEQQTLQHELQLTGFISQEDILQPLKKDVAGVIPLTYEIVYGHAWRPEMNKNEVVGDGVVKFPLAHLRGRKRG